MNFYFLYIWKSRVSLFSLYLRSTSSSRIIFRRSLFLYAHLFFLSPNVYISLQIFMRMLFLELILFFRISSLALVWSFAHFMYIRVIYIFYLQLNQLGKTLELLERYTSQIIGFAHVVRLYAVGNRDILHRQDLTITFFFHAVNLKLNWIFSFYLFSCIRWLQEIPHWLFPETVLLSLL